jgi:hypothetical protein
VTVKPPSGFRVLARAKGGGNPLGPLAQRIRLISNRNSSGLFAESGCGPALPSSRVGNLNEMKDSSMPQPSGNPQTDCAHHQQHSVHSARIRALL